MIATLSSHVRTTTGFVVDWVTSSSKAAQATRTTAAITRCCTNPSSSFTKTTQLHASSTITVALTREEGKNDKLRRQIEQNHPELFSKLDLVELPCIEHASGPDYDKLSETLTAQQWDYVIVTSPEAAKVLASAWPATGDIVNDNGTSSDSKPMVAAVGKATQEALEDAGIKVSFCSSKATASVFAVELEPCHVGNDRDGTTTMTKTSVLYPASVRAQNTLEDGLTGRGCFTVTRLNTYDTVTATWDEQQKMIGTSPTTKIACFASPSSIKGWLQNTNNNKNVYAACIGETSAKACRDLGWDEDKILCPDQPGIDGWISAIEQAATMLSMDHKSNHHEKEELQQQQL